MSGKPCAKGRMTHLKRAADIFLTLLFILFFCLCAFALFSAASARSGDGTAEVFGYKLFVVTSSSMEKSDATDVSGYKIKDIPVRSLVFVSSVPEDENEAEEWYSSLDVGDVLTFRYVYASQQTITHRIVDIAVAENGGYIITLAGDNVPQGEAATQVIDTSLHDSPNYVLGKVTGVSRTLGLLITALRSPWGLVFIVIVPCVLIIIFEAVKAVGALASARRIRQTSAAVQANRQNSVAVDNLNDRDEDAPS